MITLQALLNCLDGHTCVEGTLLFMTANNPEKMDYAMVRSCRVDFKLELGYADEYQTKCIFETIMHNYKEKFNELNISCDFTKISPYGITLSSRLPKSNIEKIKLDILLYHVFYTRLYTNTSSHQSRIK